MGDAVPPNADATLLLNRVSGGDSEAANELFPILYADLRKRADAHLRSQRSDHTLQPTALVHEAYVKLIRAPEGAWKDRAHFFAIASTAMRQILVDHARTKNKVGRAEDGHKERPTIIQPPSQSGPIDLLALDDALTKLAKLDPQRARIVELRFFGGLTTEDVAETLGLSTATVGRHWRLIKAWLSQELGQ